MFHPTLKTVLLGGFHGISPPGSVPPDASFGSLRPLPLVVFLKPKVPMGHVHTKGQSCQHLLLTYHHNVASILLETPLENRLLQGWFQIGRFWEGFLQPSSCSCAQDWDSAGISMLYHMFMRLFGSFSLLKWVAL